MPKVSVIMALYRPNERYLIEQLQTIDDQSFDDMEVVVYDDCPDDQSWEDFCRRYVVRHSLRYEKTTQNRGYVKAFEHLVDLAEGDYLVLCDQDDRWLPGRIARCVPYLDEGCALVSCDRQIIDGEGAVVVESWRAAHPHDESITWKTGDHFTAKAAFTCYSLGMATMLRADVARQMMPYPTCTGHDKWLALGASALGRCANVEGPLVQYRQHGANQTGALRGITCKEDWYRKRTQDTCELVDEFAARFPDAEGVDDMRAFAQARQAKDIRGIWQYRALAPDVARFEIALRLTPGWLFKSALKLMRHGSKG